VDETMSKVHIIKDSDVSGKHEVCPGFEESSCYSMQGCKESVL